MPTRTKSIRNIYIFIVVALCGIMGRVVWIQAIQAQDYTTRAYQDARLLRATKRLIAKKGVVPDGVLGRIEPAHLRRIVPQPDLQDQLAHLDRMGLFQVSDGEIQLAPNSIQMRNPRRTLNERRPGNTLDRHGRVLATNAEGRARRAYPYGAAAFHLVGYRSAIYGSMGLEALWPTWPAEEMQVTLDAALQQRAYELLGEQRGAVVLLDIATGDVLALTSTPSFNPNQRFGRKWVIASKDREAQPFLSRALQQLYPPGSTFKLIVAAHALQRPDFDPHTTIDCVGIRYKIKDHEAHGETDLFKAITVSCNGYFGWLANKIGAAPMQAAAKNFGFGQSVMLAPSIHSVASVVPEGVISYKGLLAQIAIGQYDVRATPFQMAQVAQAIANGGVQMQPRLLLSQPSQVERRIILPQTATILRSAMGSVMEEGSGQWAPRIYRSCTEQGISYQVSLHSTEATLIKVGGKTGTAETGRPDEEPHSWFIGFAPLDAPRYAISVLVEHGDWGSITAAPIAIELLAAALAASENDAVLVAVNRQGE